jgi:hypothetical protein
MDILNALTAFLNFVFVPGVAYGARLRLGAFAGAGPQPLYRHGGGPDGRPRGAAQFLGGMMKRILVLALLTPLPAHATDLWCMPDKICAGTNCAIEFDEESSLRLTDPDGPNPSLRSHAETIPMIKTHDAGTVQWEGVDGHGEPEILAYRPTTRRFTYLVGRDDLADYAQYKATGVCEAQ